MWGVSYQTTNNAAKKILDKKKSKKNRKVSRNETQQIWIKTSKNKERGIESNNKINQNNKIKVKAAKSNWHQLENNEA